MFAPIVPRVNEYISILQKYSKTFFSSLNSRHKRALLTAKNESNFYRHFL